MRLQNYLGHVSLIVRLIILEGAMSRIVLVPDTNFFIDYPDFIKFLEHSRSLIHVVVLWPVLCELDVHRKARYSTKSTKEEIGRKADKAMETINRLQKGPVDGIEYELYRPKGIAESSHPDARIVDHLFHLAVEHLPDDEIIFVTSDKGMPSLLFFEETKQRGLKHVSQITPKDLEQKVPELGTPSASIDHVGLSHTPLSSDGKRGADLFISYSIREFRHSKVFIAVHFRPQASEKWEVIGDHMVVPTVSFRKESHKLFLPFDKLGAKPRRHGMDHFWLAICIWDLQQNKVLAQDDSFCLDLALGGCYLSKR